MCAAKVYLWDHLGVRLPTFREKTGVKTLCMDIQNMAKSWEDDTRWQGVIRIDMHCWDSVAWASFAVGAAQTRKIHRDWDWVHMCLPWQAVWISTQIILQRRKGKKSQWVTQACCDPNSFFCGHLNCLQTCIPEYKKCISVGLGYTPVLLAGIHEPHVASGCTSFLEGNFLTPRSRLSSYSHPRLGRPYFLAWWGRRKGKYQALTLIKYDWQTYLGNIQLHRNKKTELGTLSHLRQKN